MTIEELDLWRDLIPPETSGELSGRTPAGRTDELTKVAVDHDGTRHLLVAADTDDQEITEPSIRGLRIVLDTLRVGDTAPTRYFDLSCGDPGLFKNFMVLSAEVLEELDNEKRRATIVAILRRWRRFWSNKPGELSNEDIAGLFGELWVMEHWLGPPTGATVGAWFGPDRDRHDFVWPAASVEVKTTRVRSDGPSTHMISGLTQLQDPEQGDLYLFSVRITPDKLAAQSLRQSIERIRGMLASDSDALSGFNDRLATAGVSLGDMDEYDRRFRVVAEELYRVAPGFPRLTEASFPEGLPVGIEEVKYSLNLTACADYLVETAPGANAAGLRASLEATFA